VLRAQVIPQLAFEVRDARALEYAAVPTLRFRLGIESTGGEPIRSVLLDTQIQIAARRRGYDDGAQERLLELFGTPERWGTTLRTLPWSRVTLVVPPFSESTEVDLDLPCSYDLEVTAARYFAALEDGEVPLEFLFSGSLFYANPEGLLQTARIALTQEAEYALPVAVWREAIERHFPDSAWLRLGRDSFDRLQAYKSREALASWDDAVDSLLREEG
jgi:Family of unknown function (DUF6084)